ncbi:hypothetical protein MTP03_16520 [Tsukamurella sp. PLM1]|nr:hypothetical protein MTP03_16520 [Tsukamurella sp. PLM1]
MVGAVGELEAEDLDGDAREVPHRQQGGAHPAVGRPRGPGGLADERRERDVERAAQRVEGLDRGIAAAGLDLGQRTLAHAGPAGELGQAEAALAAQFGETRSDVGVGMPP